MCNIDFEWLYSFITKVYNLITDPKIFFPLFIFLAGICVKYVDNRRKDIKKLHSYRKVLERIIDELILVADAQKKIFEKYVRDGIKIKHFGNPRMNLIAQKTHLIESIDKKELMYLLNRWCNNGDEQIQSFLDFLKIAYRLSNESDHIKNFNDNVVRVEAIGFQEEWSKATNKFNDHFLVLQNNRDKYGISIDDQSFIVERVRHYRINHREFDLIEYMNIIVYPILNNIPLAQQGINSESPEFRDFWMILATQNQLYQRIINTRKQVFVHFNSTKRNMLLTSRKLKTTKSKILKMDIKWGFGIN